MKGKTIRIAAAVSCVFALALTLAMFLGRDAARNERPASPQPVAATTAPETAASASAVSPQSLVTHEAPGNGRFVGNDYEASVSDAGLRFETSSFYMQVAASRLVMGAASWRAENQGASMTGPSSARIHRGVFMEEYAFESGRVEQIFRIPEPLGVGNLQVRVQVETDLQGPVLEFRRSDSGWRETPLLDGGLAFCDVSGEKKLAYYGAVAIDAKGLRCDLEPRYEAPEIVLEVPATFMATAAFPLVIDPWLEMSLSASGGGISNNAGASEAPSMILDPSGEPVLFWQDDTNGNFEIYQKRWDGEEWVQQANGATGGGVSSTTTRSVQPSGDGYSVAWVDHIVATPKIYFRYGLGTSWAQINGSGTLGGVSPYVGTHSSPSVQLLGHPDPDERMAIVAFDYAVGGNKEICVLVGDTSNTLADDHWLSVTGGIDGGPNQGTATNVSSNNGFSEAPSMVASTSQNAVIAWQDNTSGDYEIYLRFWNGAAWTEVGGSATGGGISDNAGISTFPKLVLDASGFPVVAWQDTTGGNVEIYCKRWTGAAWVELGGSATGGGVSNNAGNSERPSLAMDSLDNPVIAWQDNTSGDYEIYLKRWDGAAWVEESSSATGGGISDDAIVSEYPVLGVDEGGRMNVTYHVSSETKNEIYFKRLFSHGPISMVQYMSDGVTPIAVGGTTTENRVIFSTVVSSSINSMRVQIEARATGSSFNGTVTLESSPVNAGTTVTLPLTGLEIGNYHWRARTVGPDGSISPWVAFGDNNSGQSDFSVAISPQTGLSATGTTSALPDSRRENGCGLLGMEAILALGLLAILRRRG